MNNDRGLPWSVFHSPGENYFEIQDNEGMDVALFYYGELGDPMAEPDPADRARAEQRASLICQALNAHAPLLEALAATDCYFCGRLIGEPAGTPCPRCEDARAALRLARGRQA